MAPATHGGGSSYYICCAGEIVEIDLATNEVRRHAVPFDSGSKKIYSAGIESAFLAEDGRIYFSPAGRPSRIGRFDPASGEVKLIGTGLDGWAYVLWCEDRKGRIYVLGFPGLLARIDVESGKVEGLGRLTSRALYCGRFLMAADEEGYIYVMPGPRGFTLVAYNPESNTADILHDGQATIVPNAGRPYALIGPNVNEGGDHERIAALRNGQAIPVDEPPEPGTWTSLSESLDDQFEIEWIEQAQVCKLRHRPTGTENWNEIEFEVPTLERLLANPAVGPDGQIYIWGDYCISVHDPASGKSCHRPEFYLASMYDSVNRGECMYWGGYPSGRLSVLDTSRPVENSKGWKAPESNPRDAGVFTDLVADGEKLSVHRIWSVCIGSDGRIYMGASASRGNRGGALIWFDPDTGEAGGLRAPFRFLGVSAIAAIDDGKRIAGVTWTSPDPLFPGEDPDEAILFVFDVETKTITDQCVPLPGCKVLVSIHEARPGKLIGLAMPDVITLGEADDTYFSDTSLFFMDTMTLEVTRRIDTPYSLCRRSGRAFVDAPDGSIWVIGGGALHRIDPESETLEHLAVVGEDGNFLVEDGKLYLAGQSSLRIADVSHLLETASVGINSD